MDIYSNKSKKQPRFFYRNTMEAIEGKTGDVRAAVITGLCSSIAEIPMEGDWYKMKWQLPESLSAALSEPEREQFQQALAQKGKKRNDKFLEVFPHCSDEYSVETGFLDAAFGSERFGLIRKNSALFTIGSCFARNIALHLESKGYKVYSHLQVEDLNSPFSNAKMLEICVAPEDVQRKYISYWMDVLYPHNPAAELEIQKEKQRQILVDLTKAMAASEFLIVTCGNVIDYFLPGSVSEPGTHVAPKFLALPYGEDVALRAQLTKQLKSSGAELRLGNYEESVGAIESLYAAIRTINPNAHVLFTLSPVPIDSVVGAKQSPKLSATEADCISKSLLRCALHALFTKHADDKKLHYFPSFEIVRWIGACMNLPIFGQEDAASRHVSQKILNGVYGYFSTKFCVSE